MLTKAIPGAFMDRSALEGDPFSIIEGMTIGAYAMGATKGLPIHSRWNILWLSRELKMLSRWLAKPICLVIIFLDSGLEFRFGNPTWCWRLCMRRRNSFDCFNRRFARPTENPSSLSIAEGFVAAPNMYQQRWNMGKRARLFSFTEPIGLLESEQQAAKVQKYLRWPARWKTPVWWKFQWEQL